MEHGKGKTGEKEDTSERDNPFIHPFIHSKSFSYVLLYGSGKGAGDSNINDTIFVFQKFKTLEKKEKPFQ